MNGNAMEGAAGQLGGFAHPGWGSVADVFRDSLVDPTSSGAALSVWHQGAEVVNLWNGTADERRQRPWTASTLGVLFSATKGLAAILMMRLDESGRLDLEAPIRTLWPEFDAHNKGDVAVADVLAHRAGVSAPVDDLTLADVLDAPGWAGRIAAQKPLWSPGSAHAYHALTWGAIVHELVLRATGREFHELFEEEIAAPLDADVTLRAGQAEIDRVAHLTTTPAWDVSTAPDAEGAHTMLTRALSLGGAFPSGLVHGEEGFNDPRVLRAGLLAAGGLGTASALARIWSATICSTQGVRLLTDDSVARLTVPRSEGPWAFASAPPYHRWGAGVQLSSEVAPWLSPGSFGHDGAGGQLGIADPGSGVAIGYVRNRMDVVDATAPIVAAIKRVVE